MPVTLRELSGSFIQRYQNTARVPHRGLSYGMVRDALPWEAPEGSCWDSQDMLFDHPGAARKRGGTKKLFTGSQTAIVENLMSYRSTGLDALTGLWGTLGKAGVSVQSINSGSGIATQAFTGGTADTIAAIPFQHYNLIGLSFGIKATTTNDRNLFGFAGGSTQAGIGPIASGGTMAVVTSGDNRITAISTSPMVAGHLGSFISCKIAGASQYVGRIIEVTSTSAVRVEPTPRFSFGATSVQIVPVWFASLYASTTGDVITGKYGLSYQGRVILANTRRTSNTLFTDYALGIDAQPNRIYWSQLASEAIPQNPTGTLDGDPALYPGFIAGTSTNPYYNYTDIPAIGGITAIATVGDGALLAFGPHSMYKITGQLTTNTVQNNALLYSVDLVSSYVGIPNANPNATGDDPSKSIQYTPHGLVFASTDNIDLYNGQDLTGLLTGRNQLYYQARRLNTDPIYGSFYSIAKNHYFLSMGGGEEGLMIDLSNYAMGRITNVKISCGAPDPSDPTITYVSRWWNTGSAAPSMTNGQVIRTDTIWAPTVNNQTDADTSAVIGLLTTKAYMDGGLEQNKLFRSLYVDYDSRGSGGAPPLTVKADTKLYPGEASFTSLTQGTLAGTVAGPPQRAALDTTNQLQEGKAIELQFTTSAVADSCDILGVEVGFQERALT